MPLPAISERAPLHRVVSVLLGIVIACRLLMVVCFPHVDTSEARYAEISRKMVETGNWITPQFDYGVPFWAKPPLSMWMSALGMELFGVNEFGSRIFIFLAAMAVLALVATVVRKETDATTGRIAALLLMGMPLFFYCSGAVMTDLALVLGTTLAMTSFRTAVLEKSRIHGYGFFLGLAIGLLAKGPLALVLTFPPVLGWIALTRSWKVAWQTLPWITGTLVMLGIAVPWYVAAEMRTPGFLNYFIVGEHWKRFVVKGWQGDLYGNGHSETPGTIWLHLLFVTSPWCLGFLILPFRKWRESGKWALANQGWGLYWLLWALWPVVFFTPSRNIIATYPLPALPAVAILLAGLVPRDGAPVFSWRRFHPLYPGMVGFALLCFLGAASMSLFASRIIPVRSERDLVEIFQSQRKGEDRLVYFGQRRYSAEFYSQGVAEHMLSEAELAGKLDSPDRLFVAISPRMFSRLDPAIRKRLARVTDWQDKRINLYAEQLDVPKLTGIDASQIFPIGS